MWGLPSHIFTINDIVLSPFCLFLSQVLESRAAEKGAWPGSPPMGGHLQVFMVEDTVSRSTAVLRGE